MTWNFSRAIPVLLALLAAIDAGAQARDERRVSHGELLYSTYCIACHTTEVHWREQRLATDWNSLEHQVQRWQDNQGLNWSEADVADVARYLNSLYYHFPPGSGEKSISRAGQGLVRVRTPSPDSALSSPRHPRAEGSPR